MGFGLGIMTYNSTMKTSSIFPLLLAMCAVSLSQAAPAIDAKDVSVKQLKSIATARQAASIKAYEDAKAKARTAREDALKEAKQLTTENNAGMKKTIQQRTLNNMLPACEREKEAPRKPSNYEVR